MVVARMRPLGGLHNCQRHLRDQVSEVKIPLPIDRNLENHAGIRRRRQYDESEDG